LDDFQEAFNREIREDEFYVSGDFVASTDNLESWVSEYVWKKISEFVRMPGYEGLRDEGDWYGLGKACLTGHVLAYRENPWSKTGKEQWLKQTRGQLMGSPMSFPILCLANCALTFAALGYSDAHIEFCLRTGRDVRINGDDCAFVADRTRFERWNRLGKLIGLTPSPGKVYTSREFLMMNSETHYRKDGKGKWSFVPFVNLPLLLGR